MVVRAFVLVQYHGLLKNRPTRSNYPVVTTEALTKRQRSGEAEKFSYFAETGNYIGHVLRLQRTRTTEALIKKMQGVQDSIVQAYEKSSLKPFTVRKTVLAAHKKKK